MSTLRESAIWLHHLGATVVPMRPGAKAALVPWKELYAREQSLAEMQAYPWHQAAGIALLNGRGGWWTFDFDDAANDVALCRVLRVFGLPESYPWRWRSGSGTGFGMAFRTSQPLPAGILPKKGRTSGSEQGDEPGVYWGWPLRDEELALGHVELRWERCLTIVPPSAYTYGAKYGPRCGQPGPGYQWLGQAPTDLPADIPIARVIAAFRALSLTRQGVSHD